MDTAKSSETPSLDYMVVVVVATLLTIGLIMIYSATFALGYQQHDQPAYYFNRQLLWAGVGLLVMLGFSHIEYHRWRQFSIPMMALTLLLMLLVLIIGDAHFGAQRWLFKGSVQPSELSKLAIIIYIADWLAAKGKQIQRMGSGLVPFGILVGLVTGLIVLQKDLGTATLVTLTAMSMFFIAGGNLWQMAVSGVLSGSMFCLLILTSPYRLDRFVGFLDPLNGDPLGKGYQIRQILIALGSGGLTGLGLGASRQKFGYIPASHTDGIFAILGEELGLMGCLVVMILFVFLAYRGFKIALAAPDAFGTILASGITCSLILQAIVNIGVVTSSFPFTGITLPFISFGGSSLVISLACVGVLLSVSKRTMPINSEDDHAIDYLRRGYRGTRLPRFGYRTRPKTAGRSA